MNPQVHFNETLTEQLQVRLHPLISNAAMQRTFLPVPVKVQWQDVTDRINERFGQQSYLSHFQPMTLYLLIYLFICGFSF